MAKDLRLALEVAEESGLPLDLTATAKRCLDQACAAGYGDADFAYIARLLRPARPPA
jgi:3-hydroxyisobutyrate dehydrogenase-like beta-hydroxyacid dehydrogenase